MQIRKFRSTQIVIYPSLSVLPNKKFSSCLASSKCSFCFGNKSKHNTITFVSPRWLCEPSLRANPAASYSQNGLQIGSTPSPIFSTTDLMGRKIKQNKPLITFIYKHTINNVNFPCARPVYIFKALLAQLYPKFCIYLKIDTGERTTVCNLYLQYRLVNLTNLLVEMCKNIIYFKTSL